MTNEPPKNNALPGRDESFDSTIRINEASMRKKMIAVLLKRVATANIDELSDAALPQAAQSTDLEKAGFMVLPRRFPWLVQLEGLATDRVIGVAVVGDVVFGLGGGAKPTTPDFDLSLHGGGDKGVSRLHMLLRPKRTELVAIDLSSTNGTRLNGELVEPGKEIPVKNGDLISLGVMTFTLKIIATPDDFEEAAQAGKREAAEEAAAKAAASAAKTAAEKTPESPEKPAPSADKVDPKPDAKPAGS